MVMQSSLQQRTPDKMHHQTTYPDSSLSPHLSLVCSRPPPPPSPPHPPPSPPPERNYLFFTACSLFALLKSLKLEETRKEGGGIQQGSQPAMNQRHNQAETPVFLLNSIFNYYYYNLTLLTCFSIQNYSRTTAK